MGFVAVVDTLRQEVLDIEEIPIQSDFDTTNREGDEVSEATGNYDPDVFEGTYRDDVKPITINQDGPSFTMDGNVLRWQKFKMRVGYNSCDYCEKVIVFSRNNCKKFNLDGTDAKGCSSIT